MKSLRILHIDTEKTWRGGQQQVLSLIEGLNQKAHSNMAVSYKSSPLAHRLRNVCDQMQVRPWGEANFISAHVVNRFIKSKSIDVVHAHSGHAVALAALSTLGTNVPYLVTRRVDFPLAQNIFSKWKYKRAARVIAISTGVARVLKMSGIPEEKISLIPSGVDFDRHSNVRALSKERFGFPSSSIVIGQVAALAPHKDQSTFLKAIKLLKEADPRIKAVIVGEGALRDELEQEIIKTGLSGEVVLLGFKENALDYLAGFDVFCLSSKEEGLGTSILDAFALKIPVVATNVGGVPDLVEDGVTGFLASAQNPEELKKAVLRCLIWHDRDGLLSRAYQKAQKFNIQSTVGQVEALYYQLVKI